MPRQSSRTCWNPAVPPPPVPGAAAGNESGDWLGGGGVLADCGLADCGLADCGLADCGLGGGRLGLGVVVPGVGVLGVLTEVVALGVPLAEVVGVGGPVPPGENEGGVVGGEPDEQADTDAVASMAKAAQPRTVPRKRRRP
jgi:hypothetical protein